MVIVPLAGSVQSQEPLVGFSGHTQLSQFSTSVLQTVSLPGDSHFLAPAEQFC
jgi:hypothetical protein